MIQFINNRSLKLIWVLFNKEKVKIINKITKNSHTSSNKNYYKEAIFLWKKIKK